jgi:hypothetical protein
MVYHSTTRSCTRIMQKNLKLENVKIIKVFMCGKYQNIKMNEGMIVITLILFTVIKNNNKL